MFEHKRGKEVRYDTNKRENKEGKKRVRRGREGRRKRVKQEGVVVTEYFPPGQ